jgi:hypothetical protein
MKPSLEAQIKRQQRAQKQEEARKETIRQELRARVPRGSTIEVAVTHRYSGMLRTLTFLVKPPLSKDLPEQDQGISIDEQVRDLFSLHQKRLHGEQGVIVRGCGLDMALWAVYQLGQELYGNGDALVYKAVELEGHDEE